MKVDASIVTDYLQGNERYARHWLFTSIREGEYTFAQPDPAGFGIPTRVIHLPDDAYPINNLGMERMERIIEKAEKYAVQIAFENLANVRNLELVLGTFRSKNVGYCYDSCHHINYAPKDDLLQLYGNRLMALHLQDNGGKHNQHQLPLDGTIE